MFKQFLTIFLFLPYLVYGQTVLKLKDSATGDAIVGAQVTFVEGKNILLVAISDKNGQIKVEVDLPATIEVSHISYINKRYSITKAQQTLQLQPDNISLDEVVVTGQLIPQSIDQSVYTVNTIDRKRMDNQAAIDLADVLSNNLNITLTPNKGEGRTGVSMLGLGGEYVKVLVDGVPFVSIDGNGNNVDFTQINLNSIERVEIVEGPMSVSYGSNAVAGVINIITTRDVMNQVFIQEETVGSEYGIRKGRHVQSVSLGKRLGDNIIAQGSLLRNDFRGFFNGFEGQDHTLQDGRRGHDWLPKIQYNGNASVSFDNNNFFARYRFDYFTQRLDRYDKDVFELPHESGITTFYGRDDEFETERFAHNLILEGNLRGVSYNIVSSVSKVERNDRLSLYNITAGTTDSLIHRKSRFFTSALSRGTFTNFLSSSKLGLEIGYEYTYEDFKNPDVNNTELLTDLLESGLGRERAHLHNIAGFTNLEWKVNDDFVLRPGFRILYNDLYAESPIIYNLHAKYTLPKEFDIRFTVGRSYRTPSILELYDHFVDANHHFVGNPELTPEDGIGYSLDLKKRYQIASGNLSSSLKVFYNRIEDKISSEQFSQEPPKFRLLNVDLFQTKGITLRNELRFNKISGALGFSYIGRYNEMLNDTEDLPEEFFYSPEVNASVTYTWDSPNISLSTFYKYTGREQRYVSRGGDAVLGEIDAFNWWDANVTWRLNKNLSFQSGVKNILNVTDVNSTAQAEGGHSAAATSVGLTYGRSYFLKATFDF
ncbi:MAG: TonB-dependent receptor [Bacteroidota bacterium]